eukprot:m.49378 g.49378  ORF g.49378 m.49378 type:complete len:100 (-) comp13351_c0_seq10:868-1167(-)
MAALLRSASPENRDCFLGPLMPGDGLKAFGYMTNTLIKFIVVYEAAAIKDPDARPILRKLHELYARAVCNPFVKPSTPIVSKKFDAQIKQLLQPSVPQA